MQQMLSALWNDEHGQDMVEYALLLGFMALTGAGLLSGMRNTMVSSFQAISASFLAARG